MKSKIVYLIPTYNEKENILEMLLTVNKILKSLKKYSYNILIVDDNSPDGTGNIVKKISMLHSETILLTGKKEGLGAAMIRGYKYSMSKLKADIIISNEADFSYHPKEISKMVKKIEEGYDAVFGSRNLVDVNKWPISRRFIHFIANEIFANYIAGVNDIEDHNSAFKAVKVKGLLDQFNLETFPKGFSFFNYLTFKVCSLTNNIYEFKTKFTPRTRGVSKMMLKDSYEYMLNCLRIRYEKTLTP